MTANNLTHLNRRTYTGTFEQIYDAFAAIRAERERQNRELLKDRDWLDDKVEYPDSLYQPRRKQFVEQVEAFEDSWCWDAEYLRDHADDTFEQEVIETRQSDYPY